MHPHAPTVSNGHVSIPEPCSNYLPVATTNSPSGDQHGNVLKVSVVEDDPYDRLVTQQILEHSSRFACAGLYPTAEDALREIPKANPHVVFMDIRMPGMGGIECAKRLKAMMPQLKIIMVTGLLDANSMDQALEAGADDYLTKPVSVPQYLAKLKFAAAKDAASDLATQQQTPKVASDPATALPRAADEFDRPHAHPPGQGLLDARENAVANLVAKGYRNKEIADQLRLSVCVVENVVKNIRRKLHASNRAQVASSLR